MCWAIDVGNTHYKVGIIKNNTVEEVYRFRTIREQSVDEYYFQLRNICREHDLAQIPHLWIASVVPSVNIAFEMLGKTKNIPMTFIDSDSPFSFKIDERIGKKIGADILILAEAAMVMLNKKDVIIVCAGTATTVFAVVDGVLIGGAIAPGIKGSVESLIDNAALLTTTYLELPEKAIGQTTETAMSSGILYGFAGLVDGLISRMKEEIGRNDIPVVASGGMISKIERASFEIDKVYPDLGMQGILRIITKSLR